MANELTSPGLRADYINTLVEEGRKAFRERLRLLLVNFMQTGYLPYTEPLKGKERQQWLLSPAAGEEAMALMNEMEAADRQRGLELWAEIQEARNG